MSPPADIERLRERGIDTDAVVSCLRELEIETPSWAYGNSGTRFGIFAWPGAARDVYERIADAALVHRLTGACPTVAIHVTWDRVDDWDELVAFAESEGVALGAIQDPPDGQPIILFVEHQTTGGYPKPANVISADFWRLGQARPRDEVRFERVTLDRALELLQEQEQWLYSL